MSLVFFDTSALVKLFVHERGSELAVHLARADSGNTVVLLALTRVELCSALMRRERAGDVPAGTAASARSVLERYMRTHYVVQELSPTLLERACTLVERHALRAYDALQLAGAIGAASRQQTEQSVFVTADRALVAAASAEGLRSFDPSET